MKLKFRTYKVASPTFFFPLNKQTNMDGIDIGIMIILGMTIFVLSLVLLPNKDEIEMARKHKKAKKWANDKYVTTILKNASLNTIQNEVPLDAIIRVLENNSIDLMSISPERRECIVSKIALCGKE